MGVRKTLLEERFKDAWRQHSPFVAHMPLWEYRFHPTRKWRFDCAWPEIHVAVELEGGGGRHHTYKGFHDDCEKYNEAVVLGWRVLRFTEKALRERPIDCVEMVCEVMTNIAKEQERRGDKPFK